MDLCFDWHNLETCCTTNDISVPIRDNGQLLQSRKLKLCVIALNVLGLLFYWFEFVDTISQLCIGDQTGTIQQQQASARELQQHRFYVQRGGVVVESGTSNVKSASKTVGRWTAVRSSTPSRVFACSWRCGCCCCCCFLCALGFRRTTWLATFLCRRCFDANWSFIVLKNRSQTLMNSPITKWVVYRNASVRQSFPVTGSWRRRQWRWSTTTGQKLLLRSVWERER